MRFTHFIGIDVSKKQLDFCLFDGTQLLEQIRVENTAKESVKCFKNLQREFKLNLSTTLVCAEYTGMYVFGLVCAAKQLGFSFWLENPAQIKLSSGLQRGKNDRIDASRIALYAYRFQDKANLYQAVDESIEKLKYLNSEREMLVSDRAKYAGQLKDQRAFMPAELFKQKTKRLRLIIGKLTEAITQIEKQMKGIIDANPVLHKQYNQITSIDGIGNQVAIQTIVSTKGFKAFTEPRKFCCHAGVAPFAYLSGTSQRSKWRVSHRADKRLKQLFHLAALSSIKMKGELRDYFLRKVAQGKNKMTVINAVRAKLIHRIFAVIRDDRAFMKNYTPYSLVNP